MEIRVQHYYVVINCIIFIPYLLAKPFSINEAIAEEVRGKQSLETTARSISAGIFQTKTIKKPLVLPTTESYEARKNSASEKKKISSYKYRKTFKINAPLKPKRLKRQQRLRNKRKNNTTKRSIDNNEVFNSKYIPLLKSLSTLFDNILYPDSSESYEIARIDYKRNDQYHKDDDAQCTCTRQPNTTIRRLISQKTTIAPPTTLTTEISNDFETIASTEITTTSTNYTTDSHVRNFKRNKDIPLLFTRNPTSNGRDDNGIREGSSPTNHGSIKRYISRYYGNNERPTGFAENETIPKNYEEHTNSTPRDYASSNGSFRRISRNGNVTRNPEFRRPADQTYLYTTEENAFEEPGRNFIAHKRENKLEARGYETESAVSIPYTDSGLRRDAIQSGTLKITKPTLANENYEESKFNVILNSTSNKRFLNRNGTYTTENQKIRGTDEAIMTVKQSSASEPSKNKMPVVMIIDGYSIARDVNGENKITEKAIHIHS